MSDYYFYYAEVSKRGKALEPVWCGYGTAQLRTGTVPELLHEISRELVKHASSSTGIEDFALKAIIKQFNPL